MKPTFALRFSFLLCPLALWASLMLGDCDSFFPEKGNALPDQIQPLGDARVEKVGNVVVVGHLGTSSQDGVRILFEDWTQMDVFTRPVEVPPMAQYTGTLGGVDADGVAQPVVEMQHTGTDAGTELTLRLHAPLAADPTLACFRNGQERAVTLPAFPLNTLIFLGKNDDNSTSWHWVCSGGVYSWMRDSNGGKLISPFFPDTLRCDTLAFRFAPLSPIEPFSLDITGTNLPPFTITEISGQ